MDRDRQRFHHRVTGQNVFDRDEELFSQGVTGVAQNLHRVQLVVHFVAVRAIALQGQAAIQTLHHDAAADRGFAARLGQSHVHDRQLSPFVVGQQLALG